MTKKQYIKKIDTITKLLKELNENAKEDMENLPYYKSYKQAVFNDFLSNIETATRNAIENVDNAVDYFIENYEGYER